MSASNQRAQQEFKIFLNSVSQYLVSSNLMKEASSEERLQHTFGESFKKDVLKK